MQKYKSFPICQILRKKKNTHPHIKLPINLTNLSTSPSTLDFFQRRHVLFPSLHGNHHPGVAGGDELAVLKKRHEEYCLLRKFVFLHRFITLSTKGCKPDLCQPGVREASPGVFSQQKP